MIVILRGLSFSLEYLHFCQAHYTKQSHCAIGKPGLPLWGPWYIFKGQKELIATL